MQRHDFLLKNILYPKTCKYRLNPNALSFFIDGKEEKFVLWNVGDSKIINNIMWIHAINDQIRSIQVNDDAQSS